MTLWLEIPLCQIYIMSSQILNTTDTIWFGNQKFGYSSRVMYNDPPDERSVLVEIGELRCMIYEPYYPNLLFDTI